MCSGRDSRRGRGFWGWAWAVGHQLTLVPLTSTTKRRTTRFCHLFLQCQPYQTQTVGSIITSSSDNLSPPTTVYRLLRQYIASYNNKSPPTTIYHFLRQFVASRNNLSPTTTIYCLLRQSIASYDTLSPPTKISIASNNILLSSLAIYRPLRQLLSQPRQFFALKNDIFVNTRKHLTLDHETPEIVNLRTWYHGE